MKQHFLANQDSVLARLVGKLEKAKNDYEIEDEEGFFTESEEEKEEEKQVYMRNVKYSSLIDDPEFQSEKVMRALEVRDKQISTLSKKLKQREDNLKEITAGYLKDLQNMRDQMFKKPSNQMDFYEVQYFDTSEIEDDRYRDLVNNKLSDLKSQFEKKTHDFYAKIQQQKAEIATLNQELQILANKSKNLDNPEYLLAKVFQLEKNPYQLWKYIQDLVGNHHFYEVFEKQRPSFGINYREINQMMMSSKAYEREFQFYKQGIEDQMCVYLEKVINKLNQPSEQPSEQLSLQEL